jgi:hypothetical protein
MQTTTRDEGKIELFKRVTSDDEETVALDGK